MNTDPINPPEDLEDEGCRSAHHTIIVQKPVEEVFSYWDSLTRLPEFMYHLRSVEDLGEGRSHWRAHAILGRTVEWDAEVTERDVNERIAWRSLPGGDLETIGRVEFRPLTSTEDDGEAATEIDLLIHYRPTGGEIATTIAEWYEETVSAKVVEDLSNFKEMIEDDLDEDDTI